MVTRFSLEGEIEPSYYEPFLDSYRAGEALKPLEIVTAAIIVERFAVEDESGSEILQKPAYILPLPTRVSSACYLPAEDAEVAWYGLHAPGGKRLETFSITSGRLLIHGGLSVKDNVPEAAAFNDSFSGLDQEVSTGIEALCKLPIKLYRLTVPLLEV